MADAEGYRQTDDASTSNEVLRSIIFNKLPLLNSPGDLVPNTLYYDARNCSVQAAEQTNFFGRDRIAFNNKNFGSTPSVHIPNVFFTNTCFVVAELEYASATWIAGANVNRNGSEFYMPEGWGFHMIENIVYYLGSSSVANIQVSGVANMIWHMASCETSSKRNAVLVGAGKPLNSHQQSFFQTGLNEPTQRSLLAPPSGGRYLFRSTESATPQYATGLWSVPNFLDPSLALAVIPIRLPFSSLCALEKRISFDTKLLQQPIQITLSLKTASNIMSVGSDVENRGNLQTSLRDLSFQSWQQGLSDQSLSLRNELLANPNFSVGVPFQYIQDMPFTVLPSQGSAPVTGSGVSGQYTVNITSMLNADLTTIQFGLQWINDQASGDGNRFAPFSFIEMRDVELLLNGQRLHNYDSTSYTSVYNANVLSDYWAGVYIAPYVSHNGQNLRTAGGENSCHIYEINFSRLRAAAMESHMMNTPRFTNQTMQLRFRVWTQEPNFSPALVTAPVPDQPSLILQTSYYYNAVFMVGQDGGQSKLVTA